MCITLLFLLPSEQLDIITKDSPAIDTNGPMPFQNKQSESHGEVIRRRNLNNKDAIEDIVDKGVNLPGDTVGEDSRNMEVNKTESKSGYHNIHNYYCLNLFTNKYTFQLPLTFLLLVAIEQLIRNNTGSLLQHSYNT